MSPSQLQDLEVESHQTVVGLKELSWAALAFAFSMAAFNALALSFMKRPVSIAATIGEKDEEAGLNRRQALLGAAAFAGMAAASPAQAGLFGLGGDDNQTYVEDTTKILTEIKSVLVLENTDPNKPAKILDLRRSMNSWVAKYRRDTRFSGRASYGNLYSVINAIAGHYTNFGAKTPIPKKRAAQIVTEIAAAEQLLSKGR